MEDALATFDVRKLLEQAAVFERTGDPMAAAARARMALAHAKDEDARDEARLALAHFEAAEHAWREEIANRGRAFVARERAEAYVIEDDSPTRALPERRSRWWRGSAKLDRTTRRVAFA